MKLYHGSNLEIINIDLSKGRKAKDFGQGFYLSDSYAQAKKMAINVAKREGKGIPTISVFEFDKNLLKGSELNVKVFEGYSEDWVDFIILNRNNLQAVKLHNYDIVVGPIANDVVGLQLSLYLNEFIDKSDLIKRLQFKVPTFQYYFGTEKAISKLVRCNDE